MGVFKIFLAFFCGFFVFLNCYDRFDHSDLEEYLNEKIYVTINTGGRAGETFQVSRKHLSLSNSPCVDSLFSTMISDTDVHPIKRANGQIASLRELALDTALKKCISDMKRGLRSDIAHFKYPTYGRMCTQSFRTCLRKTG